MRVRPLLARQCYACHTQTHMGGLRLDSRDAILKGGNSGPAAVAGRPEESLLIRAVRRSHDRIKMPPSSTLAPAEIAVLEDWIRDGLYWPAGSAPVPKPTSGYTITAEQRAFWSFQPVKRPAPPEAKNKTWPRGSIDRFILAKLEEKRLRPAPEAGKRTLLRRVTFGLTGLPPTPEETEAFLRDASPDAFERVIDRLLASPAYGERWGRHWLDVARYADDRLNSTQDEPYANAFRYRNWVVKALNDDMPYDLFLKAQIAGDLLPAASPEQYAAGTGFLALSPEFQDERVDALTRGFLGLTVACAQCHDHKFDPIPAKDFYALQGILQSSKVHETPLAPAGEVERFQAQKKEIEKQDERLGRFYRQQTDQVAEVLSSRTARYLLAARGLAGAEGLDAVPLVRWVKYLAQPRRDHPFLEAWDKLAAANAAPEAFRAEAEKIAVLVRDLIEEKRKVDHENEIRLGLQPDREDLAGASLVSMERDRFIFWRDLFAAGTKDSAGFFSTPDGVYYFGRNRVDRFLTPQSREYAGELKSALAAMKKALPEQYPFLHTMSESEKPADMRIWLRGDKNSPGDLAPRAFLSVLSPGDPAPFRQGSGRLELAEAIANPSNPLTARVLVNRVWLLHFGRGIVDTPGNFGQLGERPSHPDLLDYLAYRFVEQGWSLKKLHREILLSATYRMSSARDASNEAIDADNRWFWRANRRRLDAETMRDAMLAVSGSLDPTPCGKPASLDEANRRRTIYGQISRRKPDGYLSLFDFPNPNATSERRLTTNVPPQRLWFMNSPFVEQQAQALSARLSGDQRARVTEAYRLLYSRDPDREELALAGAFLSKRGWPEYARALLSANEFLYVD